VVGTGAEDDPRASASISATVAACAWIRTHTKAAASSVRTTARCDQPVHWVRLRRAPEEVDPAAYRMVASRVPRVSEKFVDLPTQER